MNKNTKKRNWAVLMALAMAMLAADCSLVAAAELEWSGDIRVRNESTFPSQTNRNRIRVRTGFKTDLSDNMQAYVRFATSTFQAATNTGENNSTNQNFVNFTGTPVFLDQAYVVYRPTWIDRLKITTGKMKNFFATTPLLWDADTNPDGLGEEYNMGSLIFRAAQWNQITNVANNTGFYSYQIGWLGDSLEIYLSNYVDTSSGTVAGAVTGTAGNYLDYLATYVMGPFKLTADYATETTLNKSGYWLTLDWNKVKAAGDLAARIGFAHMDDAFIPDFRDSDFTRGATAALSNEGAFGTLAYGLEDNLEANLTYFGTYRPTDMVNTNHLLLDLIVKF